MSPGRTTQERKREMAREIFIRVVTAYDPAAGNRIYQYGSYDDQEALFFRAWVAAGTFEDLFNQHKDI